MIIEPRTRGFICLTAHPEGCEKNVKNQIDYIKSQDKNQGPKRVLVLGASTGFGLASRITSAFGSNASTIGVFFEKPPKEGKTASPGWYNSVAFENEAHSAGLYAKSINGDAFSKEIKQQTIELIKEDLGQIDLVVYSVAAPMRVHPETGVRHKSVLKPIGEVFTNKTVDFHTAKVSEVSINPANEEDVSNTITVMGGEDWKMWIDAMKDAGVLAKGATTVAYSYIGPEVTHAVYRNGTIGMAKNDLEKTAFEITNTLKDISGQAYVSVNKALVTQASSAIPVIPLYISLLFNIMKEKNLHEGCIEQMHRLYVDRLYADGGVLLDDEGRIRIDDWEMKPEVQEAVAALWDDANSENIEQLGDLAGYKKDFFNLFGFEMEDVVYGEESNEMIWVPSIPKA